MLILVLYVTPKCDGYLSKCDVQNFWFLQIPVFRGAEKPLVGESVQSEDNLAGTSWETPVDARQIEAEHAVSALIRFVNEYPGTLGCIGAFICMSCCFVFCLFGVFFLLHSWVFQHACLDTCCCVL